MTRFFPRFLAPAALAATLGLAGCSMPSAVLTGSAPAVTLHDVMIGGSSLISKIAARRRRNISRNQ